jgi:hypothetical protein
MHLVNFPKIRIKKYPQGYSAEILKRKWYGKKCWVHIVSVAGLPNEPWYSDSYDYALECAVKYFKWDITKSS